MTEDFDLIAEFRDDIGKGASRRLRREGKVPAILYGGGRPPRNLAFDHNRVLQQLQNESFYSSVLNVKVGEKQQAVILKDLQRHPARRQILHMDLQRILEDEEIRMNVPIHFLNEDTAPGVRQDGGKVARLITDVEVVCLPKNLPEYLEIDIGDLGLDEMRYISDIPLPEGVEIPALTHGGEEADQPIVSIHIIREEIIEEEEEGLEAAVGADEVPVAGEEDEEEEGSADDESKED
ncbi:MAG TPA: 50S ribosomal protein L25/general stress protein Ctc [Woeseiaceae bacterium]|nr:50S ribosomal protein L25/general stress protein Ctc [Woeseiaceae bacterium]